MPVSAGPVRCLSRSTRPGPRRRVRRSRWSTRQRGRPWPSRTACTARPPSPSGFRTACRRPAAADAVKDGSNRGVEGLIPTRFDPLAPLSETAPYLNPAVINTLAVAVPRNLNLERIDLGQLGMSVTAGSFPIRPIPSHCYSGSPLEGRHATVDEQHASGGVGGLIAGEVDAVSYTHLTLPTNREV